MGFQNVLFIFYQKLKASSGEQRYCYPEYSTVNRPGPVFIMIVTTRAVITLKISILSIYLIIRICICFARKSRICMFFLKFHPTVREKASVFVWIVNPSFKKEARSPDTELLTRNFLITGSCQPPELRSVGKRILRQNPESILSSMGRKIFCFQYIVHDFSTALVRFSQRLLYNQIA